MVRNASRALKIGVHLPFDPNFDVGVRTFYPEKFRQAYCTYPHYLVFNRITFNLWQLYLIDKLSDSMTL